MKTLSINPIEIKLILISKNINNDVKQDKLFSQAFLYVHMCL